MSYAPANIVLSSFYRYLGDSAALAMTLTDPDTGAAFNPTGCVLIFTAKIRVSDPDSAAVIQKISTVGGFTITNATLGQVSLALVPSDYAALVSLKTYQIDVQAQVIATGTVKTVLRGTLLAETDVTRNTTLSIPTYTTNPSVQFGNYAALVLAGIASGVQSATLLCGLTTSGGSFSIGSVVRAHFPGNIIAEFELESNTGSIANFLFQPYDYDGSLNAVKWRLNRVTRLGNPCVWNADTSKWHDLYVAGTAGVVSIGPDQTGFSLPA